MADDDRSSDASAVSASALVRMSESRPKRKRTILDFFDNKAKKICPEDRVSKSKTGKMATAAASPEEMPGPSTSGAVGDTIDLSDVESADSQEVEDLIETGDSQPDSQGSDSSAVIPTRKPSQRADGSTKWKGLPANMLTKLAASEGSLGPLQNTEQHHVLFKMPFTYDGNKPPSPYPHFKDKWDNHHVRMPCSNYNEYPTQGKNNKTIVRRRWEMIQEALLGDIPGPYELEEKILLYNSRYFGKWNFDVLHAFFVDHCETEERNHFFRDTIKKMAALALQMPMLCTAAIPLLKAGKNISITLSQQQIACLLANAFFCTFPRRNAKSKNSEYIHYPSINFNTLFTGHPTQVKFEKLRCLIHYFVRIFKKMPAGTVTFTRQCVDKLPDWDNDTTLLTGLHVSSEGTIEDDGEGFLQVDFANLYLGGGVLGNGCVQEEIRFLICPEMMVSRLFTEALGKNECLIMRGCERFSNYDGYAGSFRWSADYVDKTARDSWGRIQCEVVAIDALVIHDYRQQFQAWHVKRELNKAVCGFVKKGSKANIAAVCTGNWGCGAFGGDKHLKALIQMMAAAKVKRDVCYFTFDDEKLCNELHAIHKYLTETNPLTIADLIKLIEQYRRNRVVKTRGKPKMRLFEYIACVFDGSLEATDEDSNESLEMKHWVGSEEVVEEAEEAVEDGDKAEAKEDGTKGKKPDSAKSETRKNKNASPGEAKGVKGDNDVNSSGDGGNKNVLKKEDSEDYKASTP